MATKKPRKRRARRTPTKNEEERLPSYVKRLSAGEKRLALEMASPFTGKAASLDTPALCRALDITPEVYYQAITKKDFNRYVKHLQEDLFEGMARTAFNRQLLAGVAKGDPPMLKLYADIERLKHEGTDDEKKAGAPDPAAVDRLLEAYEASMGATVRANTAG